MKHSFLSSGRVLFAAASLLFACNGSIDPEPVAAGAAAAAAANPEACVTGGGFKEVRAYAFGADGNAVIATGPAYGARGAAAVHQLDAQCNPVWTYRPALGDTLWILRVAAEPDGSVIVAGSVSSATEPDPDLRSGGALLLMKLDAAGQPLWRANTRLGGRLSRIVLAPAGDVVVSGRASDQGDRWDLVARWDGAGHELWRKQFGDQRAHVNDLTVSDEGDVLVAGRFSAPFDFGGGVLTPVHGPGNLDTFDAFLVALGAAGDHRWSRRFGDERSQSIDRVAVDAGGVVTVRGRGNGTIDLGGGPLALGSDGTFNATFDADGTWLSSARE